MSDSGWSSGWDYGKVYDADPRIEVPDGMVAIGPALEEDGKVIQYFAAPGGGWSYAQYDPLDLGLIREPCPHENRGWTLGGPEMCEGYTVCTDCGKALHDYEGPA